MDSNKKSKKWWDAPIIIIPVIVLLMGGSFSFGRYTKEASCDKENTDLRLEKEKLTTEIIRLRQSIDSGRTDCVLIQDEMKKHKSDLESLKVSLRNSRKSIAFDIKEDKNIASLEVDSMLAVHNIWLLQKVLKNINCQ